MTEDDTPEQGNSNESSWRRWARVTSYFLFSILIALAVVMTVFALVGPKGMGAIGATLCGWIVMQLDRNLKLILSIHRYLKCDGGFDFKQNLFALVAPATVIAVILVMFDLNLRDTGEDESTPGVVRVAEIVFSLGQTEGNGDFSDSQLAVIEDTMKRLLGDQRDVHYIRFIGSDIDSRDYFHHAIFPLRFENARLTSDPDDDPTVDEVDWQPDAGGGVELSDDQEGEVRILVGALAPCARDASTPVLLDVTGFASSKHFESEPEDISRTLNTLAANRRAANVRKEICGQVRKLAEAGSIELEGIAARTINHKDYTSMQSHMLYDDRPAGIEEQNPSESLTRAVAVKVVSAGSCHLPAPGTERGDYAGWRCAD